MWYEREFFVHSRPRQAKGGIRAQSKRGTFGESWWAKRWIAVLEGFHFGARLTRGRSYARRGQVLDIQVEHGIITAKVQGSRPRPYAVEIKVKPLSNAEQARLGKVLTKQALFTASTMWCRSTARCLRLHLPAPRKLCRSERAAALHPKS